MLDLVSLLLNCLSIAIGDLQTVAAGHRFPTGMVTIFALKDTVLLSSKEMSSVGVRLFNKLPLELKALKGKH